MSKKRGFAGASLRLKINSALLLVFVLVMISALWFSSTREHALVENVVTQQTKDAADGYFDSVNVLMLAGQMSQRGKLRTKLLDRPNVVDARIIRGEPVKKVYGKGFDVEQPVDELDRRALKGEATVQIRDTPKGRILTVINPMHARKDYRGTDCLLCHQVPEGTVLGAVRVSYSLDSMEREVSHNLLWNAMMQLALFGGGLALMMFLFSRFVTRPVNRLHSAIDDIERSSDLSKRVTIDSRDEIGGVAGAFNNMLDRFADSLRQVAGSTHQLGGVAQRVAGISEETVNAVLDQQTGTNMVATAMNEMEASVQEVARNAQHTAELSSDADGEAKTGAYVVTEAIGGIDSLLSEIGQAAEVIKRLGEQSDNVGVVLDVIRGIAEQTNLLALNAAIEAARAGEQGRGFAVVADEVRTLATRTHESTQEIQAMIEKLQLGARDAVKAMENASSKAQDESDHVERAAESLAMIAGQVSGINDMNTQIATAAEEQTKVTEDINRNVVNISQRADATAENARRNQEVSEELVALAAQLDELVSRFKLD